MHLLRVTSRLFGHRPLYRVAAGLVVAGGVSLSSASAQVPTIDTSSLAKLSETVSTINKQLGQLTQIFSTVETITRILGNPGLGSITQILQLLGINPGFDLNALMSCVSSVQSLSNGSGGIAGVSSVLGKISSGCLGQPSIGLAGIKPELPPIGMFSAISQQNPNFTTSYNQVKAAYNNGQTIGTAIPGVQESLYIAGKPTPSQIEAINAVRAIVNRKTSVDGLAVAIQGKTALEKAPEELTKLADQASQSKDLRGDVAVNNAIMLKVLEQLQQNNAQIAALLHMMAAGNIARDAQTFGSSGN